MVRNIKNHAFMRFMSIFCFVFLKGKSILNKKRFIAIIYKKGNYCYNVFETYDTQNARNVLVCSAVSGTPSFVCKTF